MKHDICYINPTAPPVLRISTEGFCISNFCGFFLDCAFDEPDYRIKFIVGLNSVYLSEYLLSNFG